MARGRKPDVKDNVVPLTVDGRDVGPDARRAAAVDLAESLKPCGLPDDVGKYWDQIAVALAEKNRLDPLFVWATVELCHCLAKMEDYREMVAGTITLELEGKAVEIPVGETYAVKGRNGTQMKSRPEVAQFNETRRTALRLFAEFGMTPSASRSLVAAAGQGDLFDDVDDFAANRGT
ncbi:P27 family phage terminase small subunit [Thalassospira lohafexi]|uniref:Terminase n=1 Tax=Thalassospira lohafexi TaxID=744227 RepID=A0A2N3L3V1_9PROT|nr:P27 family phage terminase small subunit [Thalassospira lohafexi]PKR57494.1 terminase [Thalassospira lohafexi]